MIEVSPGVNSPVKFALGELQNASQLAIPANTKHLYSIGTMSAQRLRRWSNIVQMLYKCFVFYLLGRPSSVSVGIFINFNQFMSC